MRSAVNNAGKAFQTASDTGANLGNEAQGIGANLTPFLTSEMLHPEGLGQEGIGAETSAALAGGGGGGSGITGGALQRAAVSHNTGGVDAALDSVARERMKAAGQASEGIQAQNENLKETQRQAGAAGLGKMYGVDTQGMLESQGQEANDINAQVEAGKSGWLQNTLNILQTMQGMGKVPGMNKIPGLGP